MIGSTQMQSFANAVLAYAEGKEPEQYGGKFAQCLAQDIGAVVPPSWGAKQWAVYIVNRVTKIQKEDLSSFGVEFNRWLLESDLHTGTSFLHAHGAQGLIYQVSPITGQPICINCATVLEPYPEADIAAGRGSCYPCAHCAATPGYDWVKGVYTDALERIRRNI